MITKILLPHDGTEMSNKAVARAIEFAKAFDAEIVLLHVIQDIPIPSSLLLGNDSKKDGIKWYKKKLLAVLYLRTIK
jgi:nucleotide-binding universal stress UspA family protein